MLNIQIKHFNELTVNELHDLIRLRIKVFVVEQNCPYQDLDGKDKKSYQLIARNGLGNIAGTLRILPAGLAYPQVAIGRVVLAKEERGGDNGANIMQAAMSFIKEEFGEVEIILSAQKAIEWFYGNLGFKSTGKEYLEDNIPHVEMLFKPSV